MVEQRTFDFHCHEPLPVDTLLLAYINNIPFIGMCDIEDPSSFVVEITEDVYPATSVHAWIPFKDIKWNINK